MTSELLNKDTLRVVLAIAELTLAPIVILVWRDNRDVKGVTWWIAGSISTMIGFLVPVFLNSGPSAARLINDFFGIFALICMLHGTLKFRGKKYLEDFSLRSMLWINIVLVVAMVAVYGQELERHLVLDPVVFVYALAISFYIGKWNLPIKLTARVLASLYFLIISISYFARWCCIFIFDEKQAIVSGPFDIFIYLVLTSFVIAWNCCIILICEESKQNKIDGISKTDPLTSLANRRSFDFKLNEAIDTSRQKARRFLLILIDLDGFKDINDLYGHEVGDRFLKKFSTILATHARSTDFIARLGGDEFAVIVFDAEDERSSQFVINRLRSSIDGEKISGDGVDLVVRASMGGAIWPYDGESARDILRSADMRMYENKRIRKTNPTSANS